MSKLNWMTKTCSVFLLWAAAAIALPAQTLTTLFSFDGTDGAQPYAGLVQATNGDLYGTTYEGGADGVGTVFKITPSGTLTTLLSFDLSDGASPFAGLVQATNGDLYGTTIKGSSVNDDAGTVFKITPSGTLTTLYTFCSQSGCTDGVYPDAGLVQATNGDLYGTTFEGGANGLGTVFKITPSGTLTTLYNFCSQSGCTDGYSPSGTLVQGTDGNLYGATEYGGANVYGTVFSITTSGKLTTLHSFDYTGGAYLTAGLVQGTNGKFYGTTFAGGAHDVGTVFSITAGGKLTTLLSFDYADGAYPAAGLVQATNSDLYGTTEYGGANVLGTVFSITPNGTLTTLHSFAGTDGEDPDAALVQDTSGTLYGTTYDGGTYGYGTVFSLSVGLKPFVKTQPTSGAVGATVNILGTNLTGATGVTFNGTAAAFTVVVKTLITTTVPVGATTGTVQVVTPNGNGLSNVPFTVLP
jgi:uncharacterized repeat protein (TIGR03803 family)